MKTLQSLAFAHLLDSFKLFVVCRVYVEKRRKRMFWLDLVEQGPVTVADHVVSNFFFESCDISNHVKKSKIGIV